MRDTKPRGLIFVIFFIAFTYASTCPENQYTAQTQKYKVEFENDATWKFSEFAAYTQAPMLDRASSMLTKEELFDFLDNSGQTAFPVVGADEWTTVIDYENGDAPSYVRWYQVGTAGGSGYKSMSSWKTYSEGGSTGITALETNYDWLGYNFRWQATTCDSNGDTASTRTPLISFNPANEIFNGAERQSLESVTWNFRAGSGFTLFAKAKYNSGSTNYDSIFEFATGVSDNRIWIKRNNNQYYYGFYPGGCGEINNGGSISDGTYNEIVFAFNTVTQKIVLNVNGVTLHEKTCSLPSTSSFTSDIVWMGSDIYNDQLNGGIAGLYAYDEFVPPSEWPDYLSRIKIGSLDDDGSGASCHSKVVTECKTCPSGSTSPAGSISSDACVCAVNTYKNKLVHTFVDGGSLSAEEFNGNRLVASETVNLHDQPWTFIMKIKAGSGSAAASDYMKAFVVGRNCGTNDCIQVGWKSNTWEIYVGLAGSIKTGYPAAKTSTGNYDEIVVRVSAANGVRFRVNGVESTYTSSTSFSWIDKAQLVTVGGRYDSDSDNTVASSNYLRGHVAGFYAYQRELSDDELTPVLSDIRENLVDDVVVSECSACPSGSTSPAGSTSADSCECAADLYKHEGSCLACPSGMLSPAGSTSSNACACAADSYLQPKILDKDSNSFSATTFQFSQADPSFPYGHLAAPQMAVENGLRIPTLQEAENFLSDTSNCHPTNTNGMTTSVQLPVIDTSRASGYNYLQSACGHSAYNTVQQYDADVIVKMDGSGAWGNSGWNYKVYLFIVDVASEISYFCQSCPPSMTSLPGSTSVNDCTSTCASGTYLFTIPDIEWQFRGGDSWGSLQQHEFVQAGIALGYQSRYLTKEEMTAWMSANGNSLPSTYQVWAYVSPGQSKTYGLWGIWTNEFHQYAGFEHDGTFAGSNDMPEGYFFRKNQPGTLCKTCSTGQVTANDGAISVDACICAANFYATADEDMLTYTDSNFYVSSNRGLDQNTVYYETTQNGFALEFHHWDEKTPWANGFVLFSYDGVYNTKTNNLAEVRITSLVPGAEYKINLFHYLQNGWQNVYWHEGEFMFSVNGGSLQRFDTVEMPSSGVPPPTTVLTVAAKDDGTISLLFTRDMQIDAGGRFTSDCAVFNPPLRNCNAAGRHLVLSGLSIAPVCASCPGELTSPPGSTDISDCTCPVNTFEKTPAFSLFRFNGDSSDEVGTASIHKIGGTAATFVSDPARGSVLNVNSMLYKIESMTLGNMLDSSTFTISAWMLFKDLTSDSLLLSRFDTSGGDDRGGFIFWVKSKKLVLQQYYGPSSTPYMIESNSELSATNQWYHVALVKKSDAEVQIFIDGNLDRSFTMSPAAKSMRSPISFIGLGAYCYTSTSSDTGYVCATATSYLDIANFYAQDLHFYDYALSELEIGYLSAGDQLSCSSCPDGMTSLAGSTSISACACADNQQTVAFKNDKLQAWYKLESDGLDSGPHAAHLQTRLSATANFVSGQYLSVLDDVSFLIPREKTGLIIPAGTTELTVSFWVKNWIDGYVMRWVESNLLFWENSDASKDGEASIEGSTLKTLFTQSSEWTHMLFVFDQTQIVFYENGVFKDHSTAAKIPAGGFVQEADNDAGLFCNPYAASNAHDFRGDIKDIRFYLAAFTSAEAQALHAGVGSCEGETEESTPVSTCCYKTWPE